MPSPRTMGIGLTAPCADHEKIVCRLVSETISSAVMAPLASVVMVIGGSFTAPEYMSDRRWERESGRRRGDLDFSGAIRHSPSCTRHLSERWVSGLNQRFAKPS